MSLPEFTVKKSEAKLLLKYLVYFNVDMPDQKSDSEETEPDNNFIHLLAFIVSLFFWVILCLPLFFNGYQEYFIGLSTFIILYPIFRKWLTLEIFWKILTLNNGPYKNFQELNFEFRESSFFYDKISEQYEISYGDIEKVLKFKGNLMLHTKGNVVGVFVIPKREIEKFDIEISRMLKLGNDGKGLKIIEV